MTTSDTETTARHGNADPEELAHFSALARNWWDPEGPSRPLHDINPARMAWIERQAGTLRGRRVADIGCGGGILSESLARAGAEVVAIDLAADAVDAAREHAAAAELDIDYRVQAAEDLAADEAGSFDVVTCLEMLEHVPDPASVVTACARLLRRDGTVIWSTISRTNKAWLLAIVAAERVLGVLPTGTHSYDRLIRPAELATWNRQAGLDVLDTTGLQYNPATRRAHLGGDVRVNYMLAARQPRERDGD